MDITSFGEQSRIEFCPALFNQVDFNQVQPNWFGLFGLYSNTQTRMLSIVERAQSDWHTKNVQTHTHTHTHTHTSSAIIVLDWLFLQDATVTVTLFYSSCIKEGTYCFWKITTNNSCFCSYIGTHVTHEVTQSQHSNGVASLSASFPRIPSLCGQNKCIVMSQGQI